MSGNEAEFEEIESEDEITKAELGVASEEAETWNRNSNKRHIADKQKLWKIKKVLSGKDEKHVIKATPADWIHNLVYLDGAPFSFKGREYLYPIYNDRHPRKLLIYGRQSEKSTALANNLIVNSAVRAYNKSLYVSPSHSQTRQFARSKLIPWIEDSPILSKYWIDSSTPAQIFERGFTNGSIIFLRSAFLTADRIRGISADDLMIDELQSMTSSSIPVILEVQSHAPNPSYTMAGTPLTLENFIQTMWESSSKTEWLVPCDRHTPYFWNYMGEANLGLTGPICSRCGNKIYPSQGRWFHTSAKDEIRGYHISQLQVPWMQTPEKWKELLFKHKTYSKAAFYQEVLGVSYDSASKPITRTELVRACDVTRRYVERPTEFTQNHTLFAGIDWGEGADGSERNHKGRLKIASYTILTLGFFINPKQFYICFQKRYEGDESLPRNCVRDIINICRAFSAVMIGSDWGFGWGVNDTLEEVFGKERVIKFQHNGMQRERQKYDPVGHKVQLNRTEVLSDFFDDLKFGRYLFPHWDEAKVFLKDVEAIFAEYGPRGLRYDHRPSEPDDAAHSIIMCREAARHYYQQW